VEPYIDPRTITSDYWPSFANLVFYLWLVVIFNVILAFCMLLAHAVVPSFVATGDIPRSLRSIRPFLTIAALVAFVGTAYALSSWVGTMPSLYEIYPKRLI
jgi:hypothetical protein